MKPEVLMKAARLHAVGEPLAIDDVAVPEPQGSDVLVEVCACGVVPNLRNVITYLPTWFPHLPLPTLPAIYGLDPAGVVAAVGPDAAGIPIGQRVYVNPGRSCGICSACSDGMPQACRSYTFAGYFGFGEGSRAMFRRYPWGGFAQYMIAPVNSLVFLPDSVSYEQAARFGYLGTAYAALLKARAGSGTTVLVNGASGTLGLGAVLLALAMGVPRILAVARNEELLAAVRALAPSRISTFSSMSGSTAGWVRDVTVQRGVDVAIDALSPDAPPEQSLEGVKSLAPGGRVVNIGGMNKPLPVNPTDIMVGNLSYIGSNWFTTSEGQQMADMAAAGTLDLSSFEHHRFPLAQIEEALDHATAAPRGGFSNVVVNPS